MKLWYLSCLAIHFISSNSEGLTQVDASDEEFPDKGKESSFKQDVEEGLSMMAVGPTGAGKSSLLNALLCPSVRTIEIRDCHFKTDDSANSVTDNIDFRIGPFLGGEALNGTKSVKLYDTPGLGDSDGNDGDTLKGIVDAIIEDGTNIRTLLLVFKAVNRFSSGLQKQLKTLEYILGPSIWDNVITTFTFWGFSSDDLKQRMTNCIKENKPHFDDDISETRNHCDKINFEEDKADEWATGYKDFLGINKTIPYAFPHPVFDYRDTNQKKKFFENALKIYDESSQMNAIECDEFCQKRLEIALKNEKRLPAIMGKNVQYYDAGEKLQLNCHLYLGLSTITTKNELIWVHNSTIIVENDDITIEENIVSDVTKECTLTLRVPTFSDSGKYTCSTQESSNPRTSLDVEIKILKRKLESD